MFNALAMKNLTHRSCKDEISNWERLQREIEYRALQGFYYYHLYNSHEANLVHTLREFGFKVEFDEDEDCWCARWDKV